MGAWCVSDTDPKETMPGLVEMARWKSGDAKPAYVLLGRVAGLSDEQIKEGWDGQNRERAIEQMLKSLQIRE
jgi:hypothetical protein